MAGVDDEEGLSAREVCGLRDRSPRPLEALPRRDEAFRGSDEEVADGAAGDVVSAMVACREYNGNEEGRMASGILPRMEYARARFSPLSWLTATILNWDLVAMSYMTICAMWFLSSREDTR